MDDFCQIYNPVITQKGDGAITASPGVKRKLLANELEYRQLCNKVSFRQPGATFNERFGSFVGRLKWIASNAR